MPAPSRGILLRPLPPYLLAFGRLSLCSLLLALPLLWLLGWRIRPISVVQIYAAACGRGAVVRLFSTRPAVLLGEASYCLFIIHYPLHQWLPVLPFSLYAALAMVSVVLLYAAIETPARRWIRTRYTAGGSMYGVAIPSTPR